MLVTVARNNGELVQSLSEKKIAASWLRVEETKRRLARDSGKSYLDQEDLSCVQKGM